MLNKLMEQHGQKARRGKAYGKANGKGKVNTTKEK